MPVFDRSQPQSSRIPFGEVIVAIIIDQVTTGVKGIWQGLLKSQK